MIITSLLDTDLYKITMMQGVLHQFPWAEVEYEFKCRDQQVDLRPIADTLNRELDDLCTLRFSTKELDFLSSLRFMKRDFIQFLRLFHFQRDYIYVDASGENLDIHIKGPWLHTILFEVPVLALVNELYFKHIAPRPDYEVGREKLEEKIALVKETNKEQLGFMFSDFGTRRRFSREWQEEIILELKQNLPVNFFGTSNVMLAKKYNILPIGTMAHEWIMACQALGPRLADSQRYALEHWAQEYRGDLGIALSDTLGFEAFLSDFDMFFSKLFDGCRHDSGDPIEWGERLVAHYKSLKIDSRWKQAVFSDGLSFTRAIEIARHFKGRINTAFGIGTNLTNDVVNEPVQIVMKMIKCQGQSVAKISDSPGKQMCNDDRYLSYIKSVIARKIRNRKFGG
ncbi:nicotinate phosphoribosyltransferase [Desulforhopalus singaporensis]|uniref:Nicotinate phosphoribosyltransferase n=1 Tax=Desulforhopalus singaporensis TaxID=91360 RepID=A0A1H0TBI6_9BACT|nr:nicotinate phosphoribosyltransferase [Desulforhopalus singaporensis]SDP51402.1 nicotinate phosphoribosyltransferase [Desulforhopalus singaporensis]